MKKIKLTEKDLRRIVKRTISEDRKTENYMFFSNLKQMRRQIDMMLENFNPYWVDSTLADGHDWADDKISESKTNIDSVFDFFMNKKEGEDGEYKDDEEKYRTGTPLDDYDDPEDYYTSHDKYGNPINDYPMK